MSELAGTSKKILVQPPHFLGNGTVRDKVSEFLPREPRPAESSTPSNASPLLSPTNTPPGCTAPCASSEPWQQMAVSAVQGGGAGVTMGQGGKSPSQGLTHVGLATALLLPSKQVLSPRAELHTH